MAMAVVTAKTRKQLATDKTKSAVANGPARRNYAKTELDDHCDKLACSRSLQILVDRLQSSLADFVELS